jgi:YidC/Oxa1 family membrane protein insertase
MKNLNEPDYKNVSLAIFLAATLLIGWQVFVELPRSKQIALNVKAQTEKLSEIKQQKTAEIDVKDKENEGEFNPNLTRAQRLAASPRIAIAADKLHGSIALRGARFDDLTLAKYKVSLDKNSEDVTLLTPNGDETAYFAQVGWVAVDGKTKVPDSKTLWQANKSTLKAGDSTVLRWENGEGVNFFLTISLDADYMFSFNQRVENHSANEIKLTPFAYINRAYKESEESVAISHEGPVGVLTGAIEELAYKDLQEKGDKIVDNAAGWLGITDKYWLAALVPDGKFKASFGHYNKNNQDRYQVDYLGLEQAISAGAVSDTKLRLFAGAKEISVLDKYTSGDEAHGLPPILLFDRAVDFGVLYFLTKPLFLTLNFFYNMIGNFGLAIMVVTILVKLIMYPLANKSYRAMAKMRILQPEMAKIKEKHHDDHIALNKEMMALYKRHSVNPASGCLPLLVQMPVFFALYKVLYVTLEMRHAPFFGWLRDLSAKDPSNVFTAFGLIDWTPPSFLHLGLLPILYCVTMIVQQHQQPAPTDPVQAKMMKMMPFFLLFLFATFPAGLVLYWVWSNLLSITQQEIITLRHGTHRSQIAKKKAIAAQDKK